MAIESVNYPVPVQINGYACRNCAEVDLAKRDVDPAHPASGPANHDAASDPTRKPADPARIAAARRLAEAARADHIAYSAAGIGVAAAITGQIVSLSA